MTAFSRISGTAFLLALSLSAGPALAQDSAPPPQPSPTDTVGPAQLRDFNLQGNVVRQAEPPPPRPQTSPPRAAPASPPPGAAPQAAPEPVRQPERAATPSDEARQAARPAAPIDPGGAAGPLVDLTDPSPADPLFRPLPERPGQSAFVPSAAPAEGWSAPWWIAALLALAGGGVFLLRRRRRPLALAGNGPPAAEPATLDRAAVRTPAPPPAPAPEGRVTAAPAIPTGIVSTRLRPWLDISFQPLRLNLDEQQARLEFELVLLNSGGGPARDILVEAAMFNAGPEQDQQLAAFFSSPTPSGDPVPVLGPLQSMNFASAALLPRQGLRPFKAGDRTVFVPLVGFNVVYRGGGDRQTSATFLVGRETGGDRLAPFRVDQPSGAFSGLGSRELDIRVRT